MRVKIVKDHKLFKKGSTVFMNEKRAKELIALGVAELTKDMDSFDMRTK